MNDTLAHLVSFCVSVAALVYLIATGHDDAHILVSITAGLLGGTGYASITSLAKQQDAKPSLPQKME